MPANKMTVVITGGSRGIGAAISKAFYNEDARVIIGARTDNGIARILGARAKFRKTDVKRRADHRALVNLALDWTGALDVYVNCAGFSEWRPIEKIDEPFLSEMVDTNLKGTIFGCQTASWNMKKGGSILNISSLAGKRGSSNNSIYCATKFGVNGITQALAKELGPRSIRVNAICPVYVKTRGISKALKSRFSPTKGRDMSGYLRKFALESSALGRLPKAKEIADLCVFLASPEASAITGQCINLDCGVLPQ